MCCGEWSRSWRKERARSTVSIRATRHKDKTVSCCRVTTSNWPEKMWQILCVLTAHTRRRRRRDGWVATASAVCIILNSHLVHDGFGRKKWKLNMSRIYPVKLTAELETGSRLPTGDCTPPDATQLDGWVASAVCIALYIRIQRQLHYTRCQRRQSLYVSRGRNLAITSKLENARRLNLISVLMKLRAVRRASWTCFMCARNFTTNEDWQGENQQRRLHGHIAWNFVLGTLRLGALPKPEWPL